MLELVFTIEVRRPLQLDQYDGLTPEEMVAEENEYPWGTNEVSEMLHWPTTSVPKVSVRLESTSAE